MHTASLVHRDELISALVTTSSPRLKARAWCGDLCWDEPISPSQQCRMHILSHSCLSSNLWHLCHVWLDRVGKYKRCSFLVRYGKNTAHVHRAHTLFIWCLICSDYRTQMNTVCISYQCCYYCRCYIRFRTAADKPIAAFPVVFLRVRRLLLLPLLLLLLLLLILPLLLLLRMLLPHLLLFCCCCCCWCWKKCSTILSMVLFQLFVHDFVVCSVVVPVV